MKITKGKGRTKLYLSLQGVGDNLVAFIHNKNAHIGAVAVGEYDLEHNRTSTSVITRLGHKDDVIAQRAAYLISKKTLKPSCVIAGVHLDDITDDDIQQLLQNTNSIVEDYLCYLDSINSK
jgi:hypothetical protein